MKNLTLFLVAVILVSFAGCDSTSVQGPAGPPGENGNVNVKIYKFAGNDFRTNQIKSVSIQGVTRDTMDNSVWFVYLSRYASNSEMHHLVPGSIPGGSTYNSWNLYIHSSLQASFVINRESGIGELIDSIKIVRIYANTSSSRPEENLPDIDFSNFETVKEYYGIKED